MAYKLVSEEYLKIQIQKIGEKYIFELEEDRDNLILWNEVGEQIWAKPLRKLMIEYLNIGHNWKFTEQNNQVLRKYYEANKLLAQCLRNGILSDSICHQILNICSTSFSQSFLLQNHLATKYS